MAVFPDRIVLKNSSDTEAEIVAAIGSGGSDEITQGELVMGIFPGTAKLYTLDSNGNIIIIANESAQGRAILSDTAPTTNVNGDPIADGDLWYNTLSGVFSVYDTGLWDSISGSGADNLSIGALVDVELTGTSQGDILVYDSSSAQWVNTPRNDGSSLFTGEGQMLFSGESPGFEPLYIEAPLTDGLYLQSTESGLPAWLPSPVISNIGDLDDVSNASPLTGQVLVWNNGTGEWEPNNVAGTGTVTSVGLAVGPGLASVNAPVTSAGDLRVELLASGVGPGTYAAPSISVDLYGRVTSVGTSSLADLDDVDNATPTEGQALVWNSIDSEWQPGSVSGAVTQIIAGTNVTVDPPGGTGPVTVNAVLSGSINQFDDVDTTGALNTEVLAWNNSTGQWEPAPPTLGAQVMDDLTDVSAASPSEGQILVWDDTLNKWVNTDNDTDLSSSSLGDLTDVDTVTNTPASGLFLGWDTGLGAWTPLSPAIGTVALADLSDVDYSGGAPATGEILVYNQVAGTWSPEAPTDVNVVIISDTAPTQRPDTSSLQEGDQWFESDTDSFYIYHNSAWVEVSGGGGGASSIDDLTDVNTSSPPPTDGQVLTWNQTIQEWLPADSAGGGGDFGSTHLSQTLTVTGGGATFDELGFSGILQGVTSTVDAWVVLYTTSAARSADNSRLFADDPAPGSGVVAEFYVTAGVTSFATPGTTYLNNDTTPTEAVYVAYRDQTGLALTGDLTITAYGIATITGVSGGTYGSGL